MIDAQVHVMQRALNDFLLGRAYISEDGNIDFTKYMAEYWACIGFGEFLAQLKAFASRREQERLIVTPQEAVEDNVVIFGGP